MIIFCQDERCRKFDLIYVEAPSIEAPEIAVPWKMWNLADEITAWIALKIPLLNENILKSNSFFAFLLSKYRWFEAQTE